jgi:hypothetical protein
VTVAGFIGLALFVYGLFVAIWFARELRRDLQGQTFQIEDGTRVARGDDERRYRFNIYLYGFLALWGAAWAILGLQEYFWPNSFL